MSTKPAVNVAEAAVIAFHDAAEFETWLDEHVDLRAGVWREIARSRASPLSMIGALVLGEHRAAVVVALMYAGGSELTAPSVLGASSPTIT